MSARGRQSTAAREIAHLAGSVASVQRPDAPYDLTDEQADEWRAIVNRLPADWFPREAWPLLAQHCRHVVNSRRVAQLIAAAEGAKSLDIEEYDRLLKMQERESRCIASLATRMRISQQATYDKSRKKGSGGVSKPWE